MRKILAILLITLMALSFVPFRNTKTVSAYDKTKATMVANFMQPTSWYYKSGDTWINFNEPSEPDAQGVVYWDSTNNVWMYDPDDPTNPDNDEVPLYGKWTKGWNWSGSSFSGQTNTLLVRRFEFTWNEYKSDPYNLGTKYAWWKPVRATDMYLTVVSEGSKSNLYAQYFVVLAYSIGYDDIPQTRDDRWAIFIDPDKFFFDGTDNTKLGNTQMIGPLSWAELTGHDPKYITLKYGDAKGRTFKVGWANMGNGWGNEQEKVMLLFFEVLKASCCGNEVIYDISVESDVEPVIWQCPLPSDPKATATLGPGTGSDFVAKTQELARSTDYQISTTTFFDIKLTNREFLDLEIFRDNGVNNFKETVVYDTNNNNQYDAAEPVISGTAPAPGTQLLNDTRIKYYDANISTSWDVGEAVVYDTNNNNQYDAAEPVISGTAPAPGTTLSYDPLIRFVDTDPNGSWLNQTIADNLLDEYIPLRLGEEFIGAVNGDGLTAVTNRIGYIIDSLSGNIVYVYDQDGNGNFTAGDIILTPTTAGWFRGVGTVSAGDVNLLNPLATVYAAGTVGYITLQGVTFYGPMNTWIVQNPVYGLTMTYGDFRGMDIDVLPGKMDLDVKIETEAGVSVDKLKVEQTYTVWVSLPSGCTLPAGAKVHVVLELPGYDVNGDPGYEVVKYFTLTNTYRSEKTHNITPWRGSLYPDFSTHYEPMFRVRAFAEICSALGPEDGYYGSIYVPELDNDQSNDGQDLSLTLDPLAEDITKVVPFEYYIWDEEEEEWVAKFGKYDCWVYKLYPIVPEDLVLTPNKECISPLDQRWPNIGFLVKNANNPTDVDDPSGTIKIFNNWGYGYVNAKGTGIEWLNVGETLRPMDIDGDGVDENPNQKVIIQYNSDLSVYLWAWNDGDIIGVYEEGEVTTQPQYFKGPFKWNDTEGTTTPLDDDGIPSPDDTLSIFGTDYIKLTSYALPSEITSSGMIYALVRAPKSGCSDIEFTVWLNNILYNYCCPQPPLYFLDQDFDLIDYMGKVKVTVTKVYDVNFAEFEIVDEGLRNFENTFFGEGPWENPYSGLPNQDPWVLQNLIMELRSYPGGQSLLLGYGYGYDYQTNPEAGPATAYDVVKLYNGFNSRHAQFADIFWKLGTEYYPLTNYTIRFIAKDKYGNHLSFDDGTLASIEIVGEKVDPNAQPVFVWRPYYLEEYTIQGDGQPLYVWGPEDWDEGVALTDGPYDYFDYSNFPKRYDTSGKILIKDDDFEYDGYLYDDGWPYEFDDVQVITGIIPTGPGMIKIIITDSKGNKNSFKWCTSCFDNPEGVPVHAVELTGFPKSLTVDTENTMEITAKVYPFDEKTAPWGETTITSKQPLANQVIMFVWQDIGIEDPNTGLRYGVGDGWITGQTPKFGGNPIDLLLSSTYNAGPVYNAKDWNGDGLITFVDHETEIVGTYDIATSAWNGGFVTYSAMTNHINDGKYVFNLTEENGALITEIGYDYDENAILLQDEEIPVRITAYTYGDDGVNPREATGYAGMGWEPWEVYLAGQVEIPVVGVKDWNVETEPCLTAGVLPEAQPDGKPLTFIITDADGNPVNLSEGLGGGEVNDIMVWNGLFDDVVPKPLPLYYWVRTDLHNGTWFDRDNDTIVDDNEIGCVLDPDTGLIHQLHGYSANDMYYISPYDWNGDGVAEVDEDGNALEPIKPDFEEKEDGIYKFYGFVANDKGEFTVRVYSPDRKHYGEVVVKVELPKIKYDIVNTEDPNGTVYTVPGDPDFVMTAGDLRIYKVTVTVTDCEDKPIGGPPEGVECKPEEGGMYAGILPWMAYTPHYFNWMAYDFNGDGKISSKEWRKFEVYANTLAGTGGKYLTTWVPHEMPKPPRNDLDKWSDGWYVLDADDLPVGLNQAIYNEDYNLDPWNWGILYPNNYSDCSINVKDTLPLDENGQVTFYIETDDISKLGAIVGKNPYVGVPLDVNLHGNVAGLAADTNTYSYEYYPRYRYPGNDNGFYLDWYGNVDKVVNIEFMKFKVLNGETHEELTKDIFNSNNYDLTYGLENHVVIQALPADERDLAVREGVQVQLVGNVEVWAYGTLMHNAEGVAETTLNFKPRGVGAKVAYLAVVTHWSDDVFWFHDEVDPWMLDFSSPGEPIYWTYDDRAPDFTLDEYTCLTVQILSTNSQNNNTGNLFTPIGHDIEDQRELQRISPPTGNSSWPLPYFDAGKGLALTLKGDLVVGVETEVTVKVVEAGPNFPVAGVEVTLYGAGVDLSGVTDANGVAKFMVKPTEAGEILVSASKDGYVPGKDIVVVGADTIAPELTVDKPVSPTNKPTVTITGIATDNAGVPMVLVNGVEATVGADGKFSAEVTLKEGENEIVVVAKDKSGNKTEKVVKVVLDTIPPEVTVIPPAGPITSTKVKLTGYVEAGAKVTVNDKPATVATDDWEVELTLDYGENKVTIVATDAVGNTKKIETTVTVFRKTTLELQIGNPTPKVNGAYGDPLEAAPFIKDGRTMVPLRFIAEAFGAQVEWIPETKGINITLELKSAVHTIGLQVGNPTAIVDGQVVTLDVAPVIVNGRTFVPLRFVAEAFGAKVDWNSLYQVVTIEFLWY